MNSNEIKEKNIAEITTNKGMCKNRIISILVVAVLIPAALVLTWKLGDRQYYLVSVIVMILAMVPFFISFEKRKPSARELVSLAVMCAIAVASRVAFVMVPNFKPITGIIMITGLALGAEAGFLTGAIGAFVSNFIFGQGPWTPWQMFAYGLAGWIVGLLSEKGIFKAEKRLPLAIFGGLLVLCIIGPILDTCTVFVMSSMMNKTSLAAVYAAGVPINVMHGLATALTLLVLAKPIKEKLDRIKIKYGMMGAGRE